MTVVMKTIKNLLKKSKKADNFKISTTILKVNKAPKEAVDELNNTSTDYLHLDILDGKFAPTTSYTYEELKDILKDNKLPLDVHLMVNNVIGYINDFKNFKPKRIAYHLELDVDHNEIINMIKKTGAKAGLVLKPQTDITEVYKYLDKIDYVLLLSVEPGYGGQTFNEEVLEKIERLYKMIKERKLKTTITVDGGIKEKNYKNVLNSGADTLAIGSFITMSDDYDEVINKLKTKT